LSEYLINYKAILPKWTILNTGELMDFFKVIFALITIPFFFSVGFNNQEEEIIQKAKELHNKILTIDTHTDTPMSLSHSDKDLGIKNDPFNNGGKIDFIRMKEGGLDAVFFAAFVSKGQLTDNGRKKAKEEADNLINLVYEVVEKNSNLASLAFSSSDAYSLKKEGKRAVYIGMENGYPIGTDISLVKKYYDRGVRYITLCHSRDNDICSSATDNSDKPDGGLTEFGKEVVKEMNRIGMIIDVSHVSDKTFYDVIELSETPIVATHSCMRALRNHPRNMTDDMLRKIAEKGGVVQVTLVSNFIKNLASTPERDIAMAQLKKKYNNYENLTDEENKKLNKEWWEIDAKFPRELATVSEFVDHIDHAVEIAGINHVGIGSDFDGGGAVRDCFDVSEMKNITVELIKRGYSDDDIEKIWSGNFMRVFEEIEKFASKNK